MNPMKIDSFLNVSNLDSDKASSEIIDVILKAIRTTEMESKTKTVQMVSLDGNVLEFCSAIPGENSATPKGAKISKEEIIDLFGNDELIDVVYEYFVEKYPEIAATKVSGKEAVFLFCPRIFLLIHGYENQELADLAEQLSKPLN